MTTSLDLNSFMIAWTPGDPAGVKVGPWPDKTGWSRHHLKTSGAVYASRHEMTVAGQVAMLLMDFVTVTMDGIDPAAVHREFMKIREYRRRIPPDWPGADLDGPVDDRGFFRPKRQPKKGAKR